MPTLRDGRQVDSASPEWARECLARWVLSMPLQKRREWLADFELKNKEGGQELRQLMVDLHADKKRQRVTQSVGGT